MRDDSISLRILTTNSKGNDTVQVEVQHCAESSWTNICNGNWSLQNIQFCNLKAIQSRTGIVLVRP